MKLRLLILAVFLVPAVAGDTFTEDFEDYNLSGLVPETTPDQDWYDYSQGASIGQVSTEAPTVLDSQWFRVQGDPTTDASSRVSRFTLEVPAQLTETTFYLNATPYSADSLGSRQKVSIQSSAPVRTMVEFYLLCADSANPDGCDLNVRFEQVDSVGQTLINSTLNQTQFKIRVVPNWLNGTYRLYVDDIDDGVFPFLELPEDMGRITLSQQRADVPMSVSFDNWTVVGATNGTGAAVEGDVATGIQNFATNIRFTTTGSLFFLGLLIFLVLCAAVIVPLLSLGLDNTVVPAIAFFATLAALWLIYLEFWPDWIGIALIILVAALIGTLTRRLVLGIQDANQGPGLVAGSLGYFIIAASLLAFSGYASSTISVPTAPVEQTADANGTIPADQTFLEATTECTVGIIGWALSFGQNTADCSQRTQSRTWALITDIFGWIRTALYFLFQLLTFQLPIPTIFNVMIVLPPAATLATYAITVIRGAGA